MTENMNIIGSAGIPEPTDAERREGAIRTALFVLASSLILPILTCLHYL